MTNETITRKQLAQELSEEMGLRYEDAYAIVGSVFELMADRLVAGHPIAVRGFGSFRIAPSKVRAEWQGKWARRWVARWKPSPALRDRLEKKALPGEGVDG